MNGFLTDYPELLALLLLVLGWLAALAASPLVSRAARLFNRSLQRQDLVDWQLSDALVKVLARLAFWALLVAAFLAALRVLDVGAAVFSVWLRDLLTYLPRLLLGILIIVFGVFLALFAKGLVLRFWTDEDKRQLVGILAQWGVLLIVVITALEQMGMDVTFLSNLLLLAFGIAMGSLALAFALGARQFVSNLIARREIERYRVGQRISVGEYQGRIVEIAATTVELETDTGLVSLPNSMFASEAIVLLGED